MAELDLLRDVHKNGEELEDEDEESNSLESGEELSIYDSNSVQSSDTGCPIWICYYFEAMYRAEFSIQFLG